VAFLSSVFVLLMTVALAAIICVGVMSFGVWIFSLLFPKTYARL
jgi:hypothetical protein